MLLIVNIAHKKYRNPLFAIQLKIISINKIFNLNYNMNNNNNIQLIKKSPLIIVITIIKILKKI